MGFQAAPQLADSSTQTPWRPKASKVTQYEPIEVSSEHDVEQLPEFLSAVAPLMFRMLEYNETVDLFKDEFAGFRPEGQVEERRSELILKELHSFTYLQHTRGKLVSSINWHPTQPGVVAFACSSHLSFNEWVDVAGKTSSSAVLVWSIHDLLLQLVLDVPGDVSCLRINPHKPTLVVAGMSTGQVIFWDLADVTRAANKAHKRSAANGKGLASATGTGAEEKGDQSLEPIKPTAVSNVSKSHSRAVTEIEWLPLGSELNKKGEFVLTKDQRFSSQFMTVAADGLLCFWDVGQSDRRSSQQPPTEPDEAAGSGLPSYGRQELKWNPLFLLKLQTPDPSKPAELLTLAVNKFSLVGDKQMLAVTEDGEVALLDYGTRQAFEERPLFKTVKSLRQAHMHMCTAIHPSPHFPGVYLTAGDWTFSIWRTDLDHPIFTSPPADDYITTARWSPTRPGVIVTGRADGWIEVWDLVDQCHKFTLNFHLGGNDRVTCLEFWQGRGRSPQYLAVGDSAGKLHILQVPSSLKQGAAGELALIEAFFEREVNRYRYSLERAAFRAAEKRRMDEAREREKLEQAQQERRQQQQQQQQDRASLTGRLDQGLPDGGSGLGMSLGLSSLLRPAGGAAAPSKEEAEFQSLLELYRQALVEKRTEFAASLGIDTALVAAAAGTGAGAQKDAEQRATHG